MTRNDGYVSDITYPISFFKEQSPAHLSFACILNGYEPVALDRPFTYMELGCGRGLTSNVLAAANPHAQFFASDFNPAHILGARELAEAAELKNMTFLENSFEELAAGKVADLPQFDFVSLYGVYSWVHAGNRRQIVDFLKRYLKPGGLVFLSYNAMPGWCAATVLQRLIRLHADAHPDDSAAQIEQARDFIGRLQNAGPRFLSKNASLSPYMESLNDSDNDYLAHEYLHDGWSALYHADVAHDMAAAKLDYAASALMTQNFLELYLTPEQQELLGSISNAALRETTRDCIMNTSLRQDVFIRGARRLSPARLATWMSKTGLALSRPHVSGDSKLEALVDFDELYAPLLDALRKRPHRLSELALLPPYAQRPAADLLKVAARLITNNKAAPYFVQTAAIDPAPAQRLNMELARLSETGDEHQVLASPLLGSGTEAGLIQRLVYPFVAQLGKDVDVELISRHVATVMAAQESPSPQDGQAAASPEAQYEEILGTVRAILELRLPIWMQHGAVAKCAP